MSRFEFGVNWRRYVASIDVPERVAIAKGELLEHLGSLEGQSFCDVGCGSGIFSLAAHELGAKVQSFDYDPDSVATARSLADGRWPVQRGDVLDRGYVGRLGTFDVVYAWGVLHHTGGMWQALENVTVLVHPGGRLWVAIYNDEGAKSKRWLRIKKSYSDFPASRPFLLIGSFVRLWGPNFVRDTLRGTPGRTWRAYRNERAMSPWHDLVDWVGGYPFEVAHFDVLERFFKDQDFELVWSYANSGIGNHQLLLQRRGPDREGD